MPKLTIDGGEIEVEAWTTILQAALTEGREIPHYCYHPGLSIAGNCRMCLVEVEKMPKLVIGCYTPVADGMVVHTGSEKVVKARAAMMEFFLINHPLDCPICDQAGECRLQEYAVEHGTGRSRYTEPKLALAKAVDIGRHVMLDQERCIQCSRCTRFCGEVTKTGELGFFERGERTMVGLFPGKPLDNPYSGNVVDLCPVGALTLKEFRFETRVWYLKNTPSVCAGCSRGCNVVVGAGTQRERMATLGGQDRGVKRIVARANTEVNGYWICDEGRLSYRGLTEAPRLTTAQAPSGSPMEWENAVAEAASPLKTAAAAGRAAALFSPRLVSEDLFAWRLLFERLGTVRVGVRNLLRGEDDAILVRADKGANSAGAAWIFDRAATESAVLDAVARGEVDTLVVAGDPLDPKDTAALHPALRAKVTSLIFVGPFVSGAATTASVLLPTAAWSEEDGSLVNFEGRIQWLRRCQFPEGEGRPGWRVVADLGAAAGITLPSWTSAGEVLLSLSASIPAYRGVSAEALGLLGIPAALAASV